MVNPVRSTQRGFTMLEILSVLTIIGVLVTLTIYVGQGVMEKSRLTRARVELAELSSALEAYKAQYGDYPWAEEDAQTAYDYHSTNKRWSWKNENQLFRALTGELGPKGDDIRDKTDPANPKPRRSFIDLSKFRYLSSSGPISWFVDPWGEGYSYYYKIRPSDSSWTNPSFVLYSHGPDGLCDATPNTAGLLINEVGDNADNIYAGRN